ncbi:MAG: HD domain-containing protein [Synergistaceae bacterium]|nr:HD domain-containing protein [Synergistaceae bacterium]MBR2207747.1 HD domain-containing protein [Synergistaceae bacterium]
MIDIKRAESEFRAYTSKYDANNKMINLKIVHTFKVAENCEKISKSLALSDELITFARFLGLLHDIGRFEQVKNYGTFLDIVSVDHAEFGADLLFKKNLIDKFQAENLSPEFFKILETAIRLHNKLKLPDDLDEQTRLFCNIIRDADKIDIFRVVSEMSFEDRIGSSKNLVREADEASDEVMQCVYQHRCVPRTSQRTRFEACISYCCMAFELFFPESKRLAVEQGFLALLFEKNFWSDKEYSQLCVVKNEIENVFGENFQQLNKRNHF